MLCDKCKKNTATIKYQQIYNGKQTTMNLCSQCASKGVTVNPFELGSMDLNEFVASVFNLTGAGPKEELKCPVCGYTLGRFNKTGLLGCDKCYEAFRKNLESVIRNIQGSTQYITDKAPEPDPADEIAKLRAELYEAVKREEYEKAVILRDQLKELEKGGEQA